MNETVCPHKDEKRMSRICHIAWGCDGCRLEPKNDKYFDKQTDNIQK